MPSEPTMRLTKAVSQRKKKRCEAMVPVGKKDILLLFIYCVGPILGSDYPFLLTGKLA